MKIRLLGLVFAIATMAPLASAATISCVGVTDVTALLALGSGNNCNIAGAPQVLFSNFQVVPSSGFTAATVGITGGSVTNGNVLLDFSIGAIAGTPGNGDILLLYEVNGGIAGIDNHLQASPLGQGGNILLTEIACLVPFQNSTCPGAGNTLANVANLSFGQASDVSQTFAEYTVGSIEWANQVYIKKDIQFNNATTSEFTNSHLSTPEPMTLSMMGLGLLGIGVLGRRRRKVSKIS